MSSHNDRCPSTVADSAIGQSFGTATETPDPCRATAQRRMLMDGVAGGRESRTCCLWQLSRRLVVGHRHCDWRRAVGFAVDELDELLLRHAHRLGAVVVQPGDELW